MNFKDRLDYFIKQRHITKAELARKAGLSDALISNLLNSGSPNPTKDTMEKIADALDISPAMFFIDENHYVESIQNFLLPHLNAEEKAFVSDQSNRDFIVFAKNIKSSDLPPDILRKLIDSYIQIASLGKKSE